MSFTSVIHCLGWCIVLLAALMLLPAMTAMFEENTHLAWTFAASSVLTGFFGAGFALSTWRASTDFGKREAFMFLVLVWIVLAFFGAIPLHFSGIPRHPIDAYFEAISGLTTTGATVFVGLDAMSPAILLWRALLQWCGGLLTIVLAVSLITHLGIGGMAVFHSALPRGEGGSLPARMLQSAQDLFWIYVVLTLVSAVALWAAGMSAFDGLCHAFAAISTGGFSTRDGGIASFRMPLVEMVLIGVMLLGALNFTMHWAAMNGHFRAFRENIGAYYLGVTLAALTLFFLVMGAFVASGVTGGDAGGSGQDFVTVFRVGIFTAISALTTTGFTNSAVVGDGGMTALPPILIVGLVLSGGTLASTTGGIKLNRIAVLFKQAQRELLRLAYPHGVRVLRLGSTRIDNPIIWSVWSFFFVFVLALAAIALALSFLGLSPETAIAAATVSVANAGPLLHAIVPDAPGYGEMSHGAKTVLIIGMLAGRVELLALLSLLNPAYWRR